MHFMWQKNIIKLMLLYQRYLALSQFISYVRVDDLHVLQETIMGMLLIPGLR